MVFLERETSLRLLLVAPPDGCWCFHLSRCASSRLWFCESSSAPSRPWVFFGEGVCFSPLLSRSPLDLMFVSGVMCLPSLWWWVAFSRGVLYVVLWWIRFLLRDVSAWSPWVVCLRGHRSVFSFRSFSGLFSVLLFLVIQLIRRVKFAPVLCWCCPRGSGYTPSSVCSGCVRCNLVPFRLPVSALWVFNGFVFCGLSGSSRYAPRVSV